MSMEKLPRGISLKILGYLSKRENLSIVSGLSKRYHNFAQDNSLWREVALYGGSKDQANPFESEHSLFRQMINRST